MKTLIVIGLFISLSVRGYSQSDTESKKLISQFLEYTLGNWNVDTATAKYILFLPEESKVASRVKRKFYICLAIQELANELKGENINLADLKISKYEDADAELKKLNLNYDYSNRSYIVTNANKSFVRYFLISGQKIESFALFNNKAYLLLN
ncbi:hypothetical protein [Chitinophaga niabensis]|uniref:Uncharacterized protein n=1 Tax=Chitinophaga niabensis TaxID=536979 RepID=A0A1N6KB46_9BACT|nr:hypothetical protein [Chitinophaga niabensis]SIO53780.1 hypothetical protein SAMN04488055_5478 [Chitinophaga niabensis]